MMRVVVVDDHLLFRDGLVSLLETADFDVVGEAGNGQQALEMVAALKPDLVLMDLHMPVMDGVDALGRIKADFPGTSVVILTVSEDDADVKHAIQAGADGYILKHVNSTDFFALLDNLKKGNAAVSPAITTRLFKQIPSGKPQVALSAREIEILKLVAVGRSNREISEELTVSENTVKFHIKNIMIKLSASNRTESVERARQEGIL